MRKGKTSETFALDIYYLKVPYLAISCVEQISKVLAVNKVRE